jgi:hypothetical protein
MNILLLHFNINFKVKWSPQFTQNKIERVRVQFFLSFIIVWC